VPQPENEIHFGIMREVDAFSIPVKKASLSA